MGLYLQNLIERDKAGDLARRFGATPLPYPMHFHEVPKDKVLVCVVRNREFDAAAVVFSERELKRFLVSFLNEQPVRPHWWFLVDAKKAKELSDLPDEVWFEFFIEGAEEDQG